ncbi:MAG: hypothetical protein JXA52_01135 [Planctomycetes bacterium]|nr:hypothetical protein [Planctomycetota bacterium]
MFIALVAILMFCLLSTTALFITRYPEQSYLWNVKHVWDQIIRFDEEILILIFIIAVSFGLTMFLHYLTCRGKRAKEIIASWVIIGAGVVYMFLDTLVRNHMRRPTETILEGVLLFAFIGFTIIYSLKKFNRKLEIINSSEEGSLKAKKAYYTMARVIIVLALFILVAVRAIDLIN